jgi:hypothetical protein
VKYVRTKLKNDKQTRAKEKSESESESEKKVDKKNNVIKLERLTLQGVSRSFLPFCRVLVLDF